MAEQKPVEEQLAEAAGEDGENEQRAAYKPPPPKSLNEILCQDKEDESLVKYKQQLLPGAGKEEIITDPDVKANAIVKKLAIEVEGRDDIVLDLTLPKEQIKEFRVVLKEGCQYRVKIFFNVQREIVCGLRYEQKVYRKGVRVEKDKHMVGSYAPQKEMHTYRTPVDDAPSGMLARGEYKVDSLFTDDDKHKYLEWQWHIVIKKDFE